MSTPIPSLGNKTPEQLRVAELREELKKRGINIKGLKKDLVERLDEILRQEAAEAEAEANESKKSSPEAVSDEEATPAVPPDVVEVVAQPAEVDAAKKAVELNPGVIELEPPKEPLYGGSDLKTGIPVEPGLPVVPEEDDFSTKGKEAETERSQVTFAEPEVTSKLEVVVTEPLGTATAESVPPPTLHEEVRLDLESPPAVEAMDEGKTFEGEAKVEYEEMGDENLDPGKKAVEAEKEIMSDGIVETEPEVNQAEQPKPSHRSGPASSTDAVIIEACEAEEVPAENAALSEGLRSTAFGERDVEEEESVVAETGGEPTEPMTTETMTMETISVVTETTVVTTTETIVVNETEAYLSTAEGDHEGSYNQRSSDAGTLSIEGKVDNEEAVDEQSRDKEMEIDQDAKAKNSKLTEIDSDALTGVKRKDGEELRHQEPTKRQRRWNSEKTTGASADGTAPVKVITTDSSKETVAPEFRESTQAPVTPSFTASSIPKVSVASTSFDKPASSRPVLSRADIAVNGEVDKKRVVPPPSRSSSVSLKIDRFVRPFTIKAVRELLEQTGTVKEMWMDQIKTHCYVTYSSVEEATATRNALYGLQWPVAGGKLLIAEFVEPEEVKSRVDGINDRPAATSVTTPRGSANSSTQVAGATGISPPAVHVPTSALPPPPPLPPPPRERPALPPMKEQEPPIPTLDDLFKKTRTKPQIYFLPLTEEQVADKLRNKQPVSKAPVKA